MYDKKNKKLEYLNTIEDNKRDKLIYFFNELESAESNFGKDIIELDDVELVHFLKHIKYEDNADLSLKKTFLSGYFRFHNRNTFLKYDLEVLRLLCTFTGDSIYSYAQIKEKEIKLNELEKGWYYNAVLFCTFYGFNTKNVVDFANLRKSNIDFKKNKIEFDNGKIIDMSDKPELPLYLQKVIDNGCRFSNSNNAIGYEGIYEDSVFKVVINKQTKDVRKALEQSINRNATRKIRTYTDDTTLTLSKISYSGLMYSIYIITKKKSIGYVEYLNDNKNHLEIAQKLLEFGKTIPVSRFKFKLKNYFELYYE